MRSGRGTWKINAALSSSRLILAYFLAAFVPQFLMRSLLLFENFRGGLRHAFVMHTARGYLSDFVVALGFSTLLGLVFRKERFLVFFVFLWSFIAAGNAEHVRTHFSNMSVYDARYAFTRDFIMGSVLVKPLFLNCGFALIVTLAAIYVARMRARFLPLNLITAAFVLGFGAWFLWPLRPEEADWMRFNVMEDNLRKFSFAGSREGKNAREEILPESLLKEYFQRDLDGDKRVAYPQKKPNILIVILEGLASAHITDGLARRLERVGAESLFFVNVITHQKRTDRGLYALLCGDYPFLAKNASKADRAGAGYPPHDCLPELLSQEGYRTLFMQGAELGYMRKDRFMKAIGFHEVLGNMHYTSAYRRNGWGVDDRTLFEEGYRQALELSRSGDPWMMTLFTSGTHHPYNVPEEFLKPRASPVFADAVRYAEMALLEFLERLKARGILENTLCIITADETSHVTARGITERLNSFLSFFIVLTPQGEKLGQIDEPFAQADLLLGVADYIGIPEKVFFGRSLFRSYGEGRNVLFADAFSENRLYLLRKTGEVYRCDRAFSSCEAYRRLQGGPPLGGVMPRYEKRGVDRLVVREFETIVRYSDL